MSLYDNILGAFGKRVQHELIEEEQYYFLAQFLVDNIRSYIGCEQSQLFFIDKSGDECSLKNALYPRDGKKGHEFNIRLDLAKDITITTPTTEQKHCSVVGYSDLCIWLNRTNQSLTGGIRKGKGSLDFDTQFLGQLDPQHNYQLQNFFNSAYEELKENVQRTKKLG